MKLRAYKIENPDYICVSFTKIQKKHIYTYIYCRLALNFRIIGYNKKVSKYKSIIICTYLDSWIRLHTYEHTHIDKIVLESRNVQTKVNLIKVCQFYHYKKK